jgi:hypothetical protein
MRDIGEKETQRLGQYRRTKRKKESFLNAPNMVQH